MYIDIKLGNITLINYLIRNKIRLHGAREREKTNGKDGYRILFDAIDQSRAHSFGYGLKLFIMLMILNV